MDCVDRSKHMTELHLIDTKAGRGWAAGWQATGGRDGIQLDYTRSTIVNLDLVIDYRLVGDIIMV